MTVQVGTEVLYQSQFNMQHWARVTMLRKNGFWVRVGPYEHVFIRKSDILEVRSPQEGA